MLSRMLDTQLGPRRKGTAMLYQTFSSSPESLRIDSTEGPYSMRYDGDGVFELVLPPRSSIAMHTHAQTDEGWDSEALEIQWDADSQTWSITSETDGRDCDGRLSRTWRATSRGGIPESGRCSPCVEVSSGQRDHTAEAAGY